MSENGLHRERPDLDQATERKIRTTAWFATGVMLSWNLGKRVAFALFPSLCAQQSEKQVAASNPSQLANSDRPSSSRASDLNLTLAHETHLLRRRRWGTFLVGCSFAASIAGFLLFFTAYWTGGSNQMLGGGLALFLSGWAAAFIFWAHLLTAHKEAVEPREDMQPPARDREEFEQAFCDGSRELQRRGLLKLITATGLGFVALTVVSLFRSLGFNPNNALYTTVWKRGQRLMTEDGKTIRADTLEPGSTVIVFPEESLGSEKAQTVLVRVDPSQLQLPDSRHDWAPQGNLAYSRVCTHAGCAVGLYLRTAHMLMCPCHQSTFDVLRGAQPTGGPAARPLPQLPLYVDSDGNLRAAGGFSTPPGPGFWGMPS
ncbi:MAG: ubiquinol-cytochrome c reductase iron-sulfur subunit [Acidobacteriota bacterium]